MEYCERILKPDMLNMFGGYVSLSSLDVFMVLDTGTAHNPAYKYKSAILLMLLTGKRPTAVPCDIFKEGTSEVLFNGLAGNIYLSPKSESNPEAQHGRRSDKEKRAMLLTKLHTMDAKNKSRLTSEDYKRATSSHSGLKICSRLLQPDDSFAFLEKLREFYLPDPSFSRIATRKNLLTHSLNLNEFSRNEMLGSFMRPNSFVPLSPDIINRVKSKLRRKLIMKHNYHQLAFRPGENPMSAKTVYVIAPSDCLKFPDVEDHFDGLSDIFTAPNQNPFFIYIKPHMKVHFPLHGKDALAKPSLSGAWSYLRRNEDAELTGRRPSADADTLIMMTYFLSAFFNPFSYRLRVPLAPHTREERLEMLRPTSLQ